MFDGKVWLQRAALGAAMLVLAACKIDIETNESNGGGSRGGALCRAIGGGGSTVQASPSAGGTVSDAPRAFDGDLGSSATYTPAAGSGTLTIRGTAQAGIVRPAKEVAGALFNRFDANQEHQVSISTYLGGAMQDSGVVGGRVGVTDACVNDCPDSNDSQFFGITTTKPFDAIEATLTVSGLPVSFQVRELCVR